MHLPNSHTNESLATAAFSSQAPIFDQLYARDKIVQYKRDRVRGHLKKFIRAGDHILELNSGTGQDAIWLAQQNCLVHATDYARGMLEVLNKLIVSERLENKITTEFRSFTDLKNLQQKGPYDVIFSNFAGLNCTSHLDEVLASFYPLLTSKGIMTLVLLPKFCLWEFLLLFKGKFKTATRRFCNGEGANARVENTHFKCWYYNPSYITTKLNANFRLLQIEGLCTIVPPSYLEHFGDKYPKLFDILQNREDRWKSRWPWKYIGDYYILTLQKK